MLNNIIKLILNLVFKTKFDREIPLQEGYFPCLIVV